MCIKATPAWITSDNKVHTSYLQALKADLSIQLMTMTDNSVAVNAIIDKLTIDTVRTMKSTLTKIGEEMTDSAKFDVRHASAMMPIVYHGTPATFLTLRPGSWVSTSLFEAAMHLYTKNIDEQRDPLSGYIITFPQLDSTLLKEEAEIDAMTSNLTTTEELAVHQSDVVPLREAIAKIPVHLRIFFNRSEVLDLMPLVSTQTNT